MNIFRPVLAVCLFGLLAASAAEAAATNSFAIRNVRVFDGKKTIPRANVVVLDGRIAAVASRAAIPAGVPVIDGTAKTLMPGLIDAHVHVFPGAQRDALRFGVTTVLDMFDLSHEFSKWRAQRQSFAKTDQADTWAAGTGVTVKDGAPLEMLPPDNHVPTLASAEDAKRFVDARVAEGSDYIKLFIEDLSEYGGKKRMPTLSPAEVCAVIAAAHEVGKLAVVHVQSERGAFEAIRCHADGLAHIFFDRPADAAFVALARKSGVFLETTLDNYAHDAAIALPKEIAERSSVAPFLSAAQKSSLSSRPEKPHPEYLANALSTVSALHAVQVPILAGTDAPNPGTTFGVSLHEELQLLVRAGFTPAQALNAATALPARIFRLSDRGRIAEGARADLLLVDGDPTNNIAATLDIVRIWKNGFAVDRAPPGKKP